MPAQVLIRLFDAAYLIALIAWAGSLALGLADLLRTGPRVDAQQAWPRLRRLHAFGMIAGAAALPAFVAVPLVRPEYRGPGIAAQSLAILGGIFCMLYVANARGTLAGLRGRIAALDAAVLIVVCGLLAAFATRPAPRVGGPAELTTAERAGYDAELDRVIEEIESKYGYRVRVPGAAPASRRPGGLVGEETVREIESYYRDKRLRDDARRRGGPAGAEPAAPRGPTGQPDGS